MRRTDIEAGVTEFAEKLEAVSTAEILPEVSAMDSRQLGWLPVAPVSRTTAASYHGT